MRKRTDPETLQEFATDESGIVTARNLEAVVYPENEQDVAQALMEASASGTLVTISGAGTGITGGRVAVHGGIVLATEALRAPRASDGEMIEIQQLGRRYVVALNRQRREVHVPAGLSLETLEQVLPPDLFYPPDPTEKTALIGGTIATNASGARTFAYGPTRRWVVGLHLVLPNGDLVNLNRGEVTAQRGQLRFRGESDTHYAVPVPTYAMPEVKNAAGLYAAADMDLVDLFIGSEGILGVITEARLKLAEPPEDLVGQIAFFPSETDALEFVEDIRAAAHAGSMQVLSIEFFDEPSLQFLNHPLVAGKGYTAVASEFAGPLDRLDPLLEALEARNCAEDWFAEAPAERAEQREFRHALPEGINSYLRQQGSQKLGTDLAVPAEAFPEMMASYRAAERDFAQAFPRQGPHAVIFGHIGNYHLHMNFITHNEAELQFARRLYAALAQRAVALGGTISGEHGVGKKTITVDGVARPALEIMYARDGLAQIARVKQALDPQLILNVGNMVPPELLGRSH